MTLTEILARAIRTGAVGYNPELRFDNLGKSGKAMYNRMANAAIMAILPHIKEAMEFHGVQGAMNKQIIKRIEDQLK